MIEKRESLEQHAQFTGWPKHFLHFPTRRQRQSNSFANFVLKYVYLHRYILLLARLLRSIHMDRNNWFHTYRDTQRCIASALLFAVIISYLWSACMVVCVCTFWNSDECNHCQLLEAVDFNGNAISACVCGDESRSGFERGFRLTR